MWLQMDLSETLKLLKALADETRLRITLILWHYELSVNELVGLLNMGQSRISRHLKILTDAKILQTRRDGLWAFYKVCNENDKLLLGYIAKNILSDIQTDLDMASKIVEERAIKTKQFFNAIADDWDELNKKVLGNFSLADTIIKYIPKNCHTAVDLGCGTGEVLGKLLDSSQFVIGVDGSARMLELAKRRFNNQDIATKLSLRIGELDHLPLRDSEANFACINLVLHHLSEPSIAISEISRILGQNGLIFISDFVQHEVEAMRQNYGDRWLGFSKEILEQYLLNSGFKILSYDIQPVDLNLELHLLLAQKI